MCWWLKHLKTSVKSICWWLKHLKTSVKWQMTLKSHESCGNPRTPPASGTTNTTGASRLQRRRFLHPRMRNRHTLFPVEVGSGGDEMRWNAGGVHQLWGCLHGLFEWEVYQLWLGYIIGIVIPIIDIIRIRLYRIHNVWMGYQSLMGYKNRWNDVTPKEHQNKMPDINKFPPVLLGLPWRKSHKRKKSGLTSQKISTS